MRKKETLKDGTKVEIKNLTRDDLDKLMKFYRSLPEQDRKYLRVDVTDRHVVEERIKLIKSVNLSRIIALKDNKIIGTGSLELSSEEWRKYHGELRVIVSREYRREGLGMILMREIYFIAARKNVKKIVAKFMRPQTAARKILRKLDFHEEILIPDYVRDRAGKTQDMVIMICDMKDFWEELEHFYSDSDWQRCR